MTHAASATSETEAVPVEDDMRVIVGADAMAVALGIGTRQMFYWLECGRLPGAFKIGRLWAIRPRDLRSLGGDG